MLDLTLDGCTPEPLMAYLKALGVLRLVAEQKDPKARGYWRDDTVHIVSALDEDQLVGFFLDEYRPTPILAPWNGGSGFYPKDNQQAIRAIAASVLPRFETYRDAVTGVRRLVGRKKPEKEAKQKLLLLCRRTLPDPIVQWLDAAYVVTGDVPRYPPILGTGANDGRLEFSNNFMQRLVEVLPLKKDEASPPISEERLREALFEVGSSELVPAAVGQFHPGGVGGPNAVNSGFEGDSLVNPWDYILMIEGTLLLAGSIARRMGRENREKAAFPFTVATSAAGIGTLAGAEEARDSSRAEIWLPLWERSATAGEVAHLFAEGRAQVGRRQARSGVDFVRAVSCLGVDRGVEAFQRYGFLKRSGKAYLASPLGRVRVASRLEGELLHDMDRWLERFRSSCRARDAPPRYASALRRIDEAVFELCLHGGARHLQEVLVALGRAERALASGARFREEHHIRPLHNLSLRWLTACDDGSPEFRLAVAMSSMWHRDVSHIRVHMEPVTMGKGLSEWTKVDHAVAWGAGSIERNMAAVMERRLTEASKANIGALPLDGKVAATLPDIHSFLTGQVDGGRLEELVWGLITLRWGEDAPPPRPNGERPATLSRAYALLKLLFLPQPLRWGGAETSIKAEPEVLSRLRGGDLQTACGIARRRLRASGLVPLASDFTATPEETRRILAVLLLPIGGADIRYLANLVLRPPPDVAG